MTGAEQDALDAAAGNREAFGRLVARHAGVVRSIALAITADGAAADDIAQDVFVRSWTELRNLRDPAAFGGWLRQVTRRRAIDWLRERGRDASPPEEGLHDDRATPIEALIELEDRARVSRALELLRAEDREVLALHYGEGLKLSEVAAVLDIEEPAAKKRLSRARERLRDATESVAGSLEREQRDARQRLPALVLMGLPRPGEAGAGAAKVAARGAGVSGVVAGATAIVVVIAFVMLAAGAREPHGCSDAASSGDPATGPCAGAPTGSGPARTGWWPWSASAKDEPGGTVSPAGAEGASAQAASASGAIEGRVFFRGEPAAGVEVLADACRKPPAEGELDMVFHVEGENVRTTTARDGRFRITGLPSGEICELEARDAVRGRAGASALAVGGAPVELELRMGGTIRGQVVDEGGAPVPFPESGITAMLAIDALDPDPRAGEPENHHRQLLRLGPDATFEENGLAPGRYELRAVISGRVMPKPVVVEIAEGGSAVARLVVPASGGYEVTGLALDGKGRHPAENAAVAIRAGGAIAIVTRTDSEGRFTVGGLDGEVTLVVSLDDKEAVADVARADRSGRLTLYLE